MSLQFSKHFLFDENFLTIDLIISFTNNTGKSHDRLNIPVLLYTTFSFLLINEWWHRVSLLFCEMGIMMLLILNGSSLLRHVFTDHGRKGNSAISHSCNNSGFPLRTFYFCTTAIILFYTFPSKVSSVYFSTSLSILTIFFVENILDTVLWNMPWYLVVVCWEYHLIKTIKLKAFLCLLVICVFFVFRNISSTSYILQLCCYFIAEL